jgi:6-pyruvoyltetrahydropterin/6-carboxytetrahydropterin synthase
MSLTVTRRIQFCAGHRVYKHESKCSNFHGHNYVAFITCEFNKGVDGLGRVVDFSVIKDKIGTWIDTYWDHGFIFFANDPEAVALYSPGGLLEKHKHFILPENPTAENMARFLLLEVGPALFEGTGVRIVEVKLDETENCSTTVNFMGGTE